jgi:iron complex transport system permease protein
MSHSIPAKPSPTEPITAPALQLGLQMPLLLGLIAITALIFILSIALGSINISLEDIFRVFMNQEPERTSATRIIHNVRLPQTLTALFAGAGLGVSGLMMQTFFRNPLADPFILGITSGASLGVALVVLGIGSFSVASVVAFGVRGDLVIAFVSSIGAGLTLLIVLAVLQRVRSSLTLLILGVMFGYMTSAFVSLMLYFSAPQQVDAYITWSFGTFGRVTKSQLSILLPVVAVGLSGAMLMTKSLNALLLGEAYAHSMGLNLKRASWGIIGATGILAGVITAFCGPVSFIGMAVPHLCRSLFNTSDHRVLMPACMFMGGSVAMIAGLIARVPGSHLMLPLNAVTAFLGAPVIIWVILKQNNLNRTFAQ